MFVVHLQKSTKMPPNATSNIVECTGVLNECDAETIDGGLDKNIVELKHAEKRKASLVWRNILLFGYVHLAAVYGAYLMLFEARIYTGIFGNYSKLPFSQMKISACCDCEILTVVLFSICSISFILDFGNWYHGWSTSSLGPSSIQSKTSIKNPLDFLQHDCISRLCHPLGT